MVKRMLDHLNQVKVTRLNPETQGNYAGSHLQRAH